MRNRQPWLEKNHFFVYFRKKLVSANSEVKDKSLTYQFQIILQIPPNTLEFKFIKMTWLKQTNVFKNLMAESTEAGIRYVLCSQTMAKL